MQLDPMSHELTVLKDKEFQVGREFEHMLKQATTRMQDEVSKVHEDLRRLKVLNETEAVRSQVSLLESEVVDLKNMYRIPLQRGS